MNCRDCGKYVNVTIDSNLVPQSVSKFIVCVRCSAKIWKALGGFGSGDFKKYLSMVGRERSK
ncbi:hypothetical protein CMI37_25765 [Candidatus Pacearchaeota archaeon]|nr:hypothetical protein [Candidatus Pacearchaeota archaeon]